MRSAHHTTAQPAEKQVLIGADQRWSGPLHCISSASYGLTGPKIHRVLSVVASFDQSILTYADLRYHVWNDPAAHRLRGHLVFDDTEQFELEIHYLDDGDAVFACGGTLDGYPMPMTDEATMWLTEIVRIELTHLALRAEATDHMTRELAQ